jgi:hypothetical protein
MTITPHPIADKNSRTVIDEATARLATLRGLRADDAAARLHLYASLAIELRICTAGATADLHNHDVSWAEIATLLGISEGAAVARFAEPEEVRPRRRSQSQRR